MTRRIYCDRHIASALRACPRCLEEDNKKMQQIVDAALDVFRDPGDNRLPYLDECAYMKNSGIKKLYAAVEAFKLKEPG